MAKLAVKPLSQILEPSNRQGCLSATRALGRCFECKNYMSSAGRPCPSRVENKEYNRLVAERKAKWTKWKAKRVRVEEEIEKL